MTEDTSQPETEDKAQEGEAPIMLAFGMEPGMAQRLKEFSVNSGIPAPMIAHLAVYQFLYSMETFAELLAQTELGQERLAEIIGEEAERESRLVVPETPGIIVPPGV